MFSGTRAAAPQSSLAARISGIREWINALPAKWDSTPWQLQPFDGDKPDYRHSARRWDPRHPDWQPSVANEVYQLFGEISSDSDESDHEDFIEVGCPDQSTEPLDADDAKGPDSDQDIIQLDVDLDPIFDFCK